VSQPPQNDSDDLSPELLPNLSEFDSAVDINQFLHSHCAIDRKNPLQLEDADPPRLDPRTIPRPGESRTIVREPVPMAWTIPGANLDPERKPS
jgi:hypothetical protein